MIEKHLPPTRGRMVLHWFTGRLPKSDALSIRLLFLRQRRDACE
jgi:hypothetical protein